MIVFALIHLAPGDPLTAFWGPRPLPEEMRMKLIADMGLDQPLPVQYLYWLRNLFQGDLGFSFLNQQPVWKLVSDRVVPTLELVIAAEFLAVMLAIVLGVIAAVKHNSIIDGSTSLVALIGYSTPNFWMGLMLILFFSQMVVLLPSGFRATAELVNPTFIEILGDRLRHGILPVFVLALGWTAYLFRLVRSSMLEVLSQDYIVTARAKGLRERVVIYKHALRNALLPVVTYLGFSIGFLFSGAVVIEEVFSWLGLGSLMVFAANLRDYPVLMGLNMIIAFMVLLGNLIADIAYALVDPRITYD